jgi:hypothetical protein
MNAPIKLVPVPDCPAEPDCCCGAPADFMAEVWPGSNVYEPKCADHVERATDPSARFSELEVAAIRGAAETLDALWDLDAARGKNDARDGAEYRRLSVAPILRGLIDEEAG